MSTAARTAAALQARQRRTEVKLEQIRGTLARLRREQGALTFQAVARDAGVSRTFLYENPKARTLVEQAITAAGASRAQPMRAHDSAGNPAWRERALNAEHALKTAHTEIRTQRDRIGALLGEIRDLELDHPRHSAQHLATENTSLKQRLHQLTQDTRILDERLRAARSNLRFQDRRIADLEASLLSTDAPDTSGSAL